MTERATVPRRFVSTSVEVEGREEIKVVELPPFEPPPWDDAAALTVVGSPVRRMDALEKVTGQAGYTADVRLPGMLFAALQSPPKAPRPVTAQEVVPCICFARSGS
jgi:hypothetical protein